MPRPCSLPAARRLIAGDPPRCRRCWRLVASLDAVDLVRSPAAGILAYKQRWAPSSPLAR